MKRVNSILMSGSAWAVAHVLVAMSATPAHAARIGRCEGLFVATKNVPAAKAKSAAATNTNVAKPVEAPKPSSRELVVEDIPMYIKERVVLGGALSTYLRGSHIPEAYAASVDTKPRTEDGEFMAVSFLTEIRAAVAPSASAQLGYSSNPMLALGNSSSGNRNAVAIQTPKATSVAEVRAMGLNPTEILTNYIKHESSGSRLDEQSIQYIVKTMQNDPDYMGRALVHHQKRSLRPEGSRALGDGASNVVNLANTGVYRYFRFTPTGSTQEVIARVLDINHDRTGSPGFNVLVEWMKPANDSDVRIRHIQSLTAEELRLMRPMPESIRKVIASEFNDSLSPYEIRTRKLAEIAGLKTFGFTEMSRKAGGSNRITDPLAYMSGQAHIVSRKHVEDRFGKLDDLLTTEERNAPMDWRIFDVMARLNPKFILKRFDGRGTDFRYIFVITEDGQLKISPFTEGTANYRPEILRMAHGRRIFAGGEFSVAQDGRLNVRLRSDEYQDINSEYGVHRAFQTQGQEGLNSFVAFTFGLQAGRGVTNVSSDFARTFYTEKGFGEKWVDDLGGDRYKHDPNFQSFSGERRETNGRFGGFGSQNSYDYARDAFESAGLGRGSQARAKAAELKWTNEKGPLAFDTWAKQAGGHKTEWSHYALRTNPQMSFEAIKKAYRKLAQELHPDRRNDIPEPQARAIFQTMKEAFEHMEAELK